MEVTVTERDILHLQLMEKRVKDLIGADTVEKDKLYHMEQLKQIQQELKKLEQREIFF